MSLGMLALETYPLKSKLPCCEELTLTMQRRTEVLTESLVELSADSSINLPPCWKKTL